MSALIATLQRELRAYFFSPLAYVVLTFFLLINGYVFSLIVSFLADPRAGGDATPLKLFFGDTFFFWVILLFITPILTMRLLAEERRSGSIESLMTAPVSENQVVVGKFLAAFAFYVFLWLPTLVYVMIIARNSDVDWGPIVGGYLGVFELGALFLAIGVFCSSFTKSQIVAAIATFALLLVLFAVAFLDSLVSSQLLKDIFGHMNMLQHLDEMGRGIVDTRRLVYYLSATVFFLFLAGRTLEAKKWR